MIYGYKGLKKGNKTYYGDVLEEGITYSVEGPLVAGQYDTNNGNGYHMCETLADVFKFFDRDEEIEIAYVEGSDDNIEFSHEYYGNLGMHVCRSIKILRMLSREEVLNKILCSGSMNITTFLSCAKLNVEEIDLFLDSCRSYPMLLGEILYHQKGYKDIFNDRIEGKRIIEEEIKRIDAAKGKAKIIEK